MKHHPDIREGALLVEIFAALVGILLFSLYGNCLQIDTALCNETSTDLFISASLLLGGAFLYGVALYPKGINRILIVVMTLFMPFIATISYLLEGNLTQRYHTIILLVLALGSLGMMIWLYLGDPAIYPAPTRKKSSKKRG